MPDGPAAASAGPVEFPASDRLDSWKEIAAYLGREVRTVQRWEKKEGLPVHRHLHDKLGTVYAYKSELDAWRNSRRLVFEQEDQAEEAGQEESFTPESGTSRPAEPEDTQEEAPPRRGAFRLATWSLLAVLVAGGLYLGRRSFAPQPKPRAGKVMLAVLPFENLSGDAQQEFFSDGITEEMITQLGRLQPDRLGVIARATMMQYKGGHKSVEEIGAELHVEYILEGSVRRAGDRVRIAARLIQVNDQTHLWAEDYDRDLRDILAIQSDVARAIAGQIQLKLTPAQTTLTASRARLGLAGTRAVNPEAYDAYLRGRFFWNNRTDEGLKKSIDEFNLAIQKDPNDALAYAGLADSYDVLGFFGLLPPQEAYRKAKAAALKALELDDSIAEAQVSLADVAYHYERDWAGAERQFKRALELNPNYPTAHQWYAVFLDVMGRTEEARVEIDRARALDPLSLVIHTDTASHFYYARQYDQAIEEARKALEMVPDFPLGHVWLGMAYLQKKSYSEAIAEFRRARATWPTNMTVLALLGHAYGAAGQHSEALNVINELKSLSRQRYVSPACFAVVYIGMGDRNQAFQWIDKAYQEHAPLLARLKSEPLVDSLRSDPRFNRIVARLKFPAEQTAAAAPNKKTGENAPTAP